MGVYRQAEGANGSKQSSCVRTARFVVRTDDTRDVFMNGTGYSSVATLCMVTESVFIMLHYAYFRAVPICGLSDATLLSLQRIPGLPYLDTPFEDGFPPPAELPTDEWVSAFVSSTKKILFASLRLTSIVCSNSARNELR